MTFSPDNFIFFYLILAFFALAIAVTAHATIPGDRKKRKLRR